MRDFDASIADEIRAFGWLVPADRQTQSRLLGMLRSIRAMEDDVGSVELQDTRAPEPPGAEDPPVAPSNPPLKAQEPAPVAPPPTPLRKPGRPGKTLAEVTTVTRLANQHLPQARVVAAPTLRAEPTLPRPRTPLAASILAARQARAVLTLLAASQGELRLPDLERAIQELAEGRPLRRLPLQRALTTRRGIQLLIDCSAAMAPLAFDCEQVRSALTRLLGATSVETAYFAGSPVRDPCIGTHDELERWQSPAAGVPIVVISDMGLAGSPLHEDWASPAEWLQFAELARASGNPVIVLSPYPGDRWPEVLTRRFTWVPWSERLSAAQLNRIRRDADSRGR